MAGVRHPACLTQALHELRTVRRKGGAIARPAIKRLANGLESVAIGVVRCVQPTLDGLRLRSRALRDAHGAEGAPRAELHLVVPDLQGLPRAALRPKAGLQLARHGARPQHFGVVAHGRIRDPVLEVPIAVVPERVPEETIVLQLGRQLASARLADGPAPHVAGVRVFVEELTDLRRREHPVEVFRLHRPSGHGEVVQRPSVEVEPRHVCDLLGVRRAIALHDAGLLAACGRRKAHVRERRTGVHDSVSRANAVDANAERPLSVLGDYLKDKVPVGLADEAPLWRKFQVVHKVRRSVHLRARGP
mmetsp:Transcript_36329/g.113173  ORF Transcript_36329/g.113173 Transcript_36329/m.113173 type:complete len:304 (+) Transcript_36329:2564-3475(+)